MNFVRTAIKTALYAAAALPVAGAWALTPAQVSGLSATNIIYVSGSTATDAALQAWAKLDPGVDSSAPFAAGTYDLYKTATGYVLTGTATSVFGAAAGQNIAFVKQTKGGSATGIHNVVAGTSPGGFPDLTTPSSFSGSCGTPAASGTARPFQAFNTYTCTLAESATIVPNAGISDQDPTTWIGTGGVIASDATSLTSVRAVEVPFAVVISTALRNQLQSLEGLSSGSETLANVPSLTAAQVRALLSGQMTSWGDLFVFNPSTSTVGKVDTTGSLVHVCRRGDTSGSQFAANIRFFGKGCSKGQGVGQVQVPDDTSTQANGETWTGTTDADGNNQLGDLVFAGSGTGDVLKCVAAPVDNVANGDPIGSDTVAYRIGFVSTDQVATTAGGWRYAAVDGIAPTIWNIQLGKYEWLFEDAFNSNATSLARNGGAGNHAAIFNTVATQLSNVNALAGLNAASQNSAALGDASGGAADTGIVTAGNKVLFGSSDPSGPSAPTWPAAIRAIATAGEGPNSPVSKTYPGQAENNCNGTFVSNPSG